MADTTVTVHVTIGRNIGDTPMSEASWYDFWRAVEDTMSTKGELHFVGTGQGFYEGIAEESAHCVATVPYASVPSLRKLLEGLATQYAQEAIALTIGKVEFI